jgi:hypothetical protein
MPDSPAPSRSHDLVHDALQLAEELPAELPAKSTVIRTVHWRGPGQRRTGPMSDGGPVSLRKRDGSSRRRSLGMLSQLGVGAHAVRLR